MLEVANIWTQEIMGYTNGNFPLGLLPFGLLPFRLIPFGLLPIHLLWKWSISFPIPFSSTPILSTFFIYYDSNVNQAVDEMGVDHFFVYYVKPGLHE